MYIYVLFFLFQDNTENTEPWKQKEENIYVHVYWVLIFSVFSGNRKKKT
jgi:hypothetical protein